MRQKSSLLWRLERAFRRTKLYYTDVSFLSIVINFMEKLLSVKIYGKVQGVSFRYYAREKARALSLFGFARNEPDGTAYFEAEGEEEDLKKFLEWCHKGPDTARVEKVEFSFSAELKKYDEFKVL